MMLLKVKLCAQLTHIKLLPIMGDDATKNTVTIDYFCSNKCGNKFSFHHFVSCNFFPFGEVICGGQYVKLPQ